MKKADAELKRKVAEATILGIGDDGGSFLPMFAFGLQLDRKLRAKKAQTTTPPNEEES